MAAGPAAPASTVPSKGAGMKKKIPVSIKTGDRLGWVDNALHTYPPEQFITGLGIAPDRRRAQQKALQELTKPFIKAIAKRIAMQRQAWGHLPNRLDQAYAPMADRSRARALESVMAHGRLAEMFVEKQPQPTVYALAVLERADCRHQLRQRVNDIDERLQTHVKQVNTAGGHLSSANRIQLLQTYLDREALDAALAVVDPQGKRVAPPIPPHAMDRWLKKK